MPHHRSSHHHDSKRQRRSTTSSAAAIPSSVPYLGSPTRNIIHQSVFPPTHNISYYGQSDFLSPDFYSSESLSQTNSAHVTPPTGHVADFQGGNYIHYINGSPGGGISYNQPFLYGNAGFAETTLLYTPGQAPSYHSHTQAQPSPIPLQPLDPNISTNCSNSTYTITPAAGNTRSTPIYYTNISTSQPVTPRNYNINQTTYQPGSWAPQTREGSPSSKYNTTPPYPTPQSVTSASFAPSRVLQYLTQPNCVVDSRLVAHEPQLTRYTHAWFDIRNLTSWDNFNATSMTTIPEMVKALNTCAALQTPANPSPLQYAGRELLSKCVGHLCVRVNEALRIVQGQPHISIRTLSSSTKRFQPDFVSSYEDDDDKTIEGDGRGRVVGVLKPSNLWNTRMRDGSVYEQKRYLAALADIHQAMREHNCRYGFVISEFELVCVRYRATRENYKIPLFGALELSPSIPIAGTPSAGSPGHPPLTAGIALFYLHMLAQDSALPGHLKWKLKVGTPKERTRKFHNEKVDNWIPTPLSKEKRDVKLARGWHSPDEPVSKYEKGLDDRGKRRRRGRS
ncbi:hypothetical protein K461DRAFT_292429 [Myriangium duriaei CBS 260.36]|uniref:Uncharacterized protein n=1 Tax=Myriangium duriaei CBS 260.36 TaxID=1168546 RepID=A0A9P4J1F3_9PEZI|nr:hypothetical protein K461DRAFT_292429 [Myriangium duriaei CBS 260.36]